MLPIRGPFRTHLHSTKNAVLPVSMKSSPSQALARCSLLQRFSDSSINGLAWQTPSAWGRRKVHEFHGAFWLWFCLNGKAMLLEYKRSFCVHISGVSDLFKHCVLHDICTEQVWNLPSENRPSKP